MLKGVGGSGIGFISSNSRIHLRQYHVCLYVTVLFATRPAPFTKLQIDIPRRDSMISIVRDETSLWQFQNVVEEADFQNERTTFDLKKVYIIIHFNSSA